MTSVDVVIPNYNYGRYLHGCVESVLTQDIEVLRVLIIDNASTDDSLKIAGELAAQDPRIEVITRAVNLGLHASFNEGIDRAKADYFTVLCADDRLTPGALKRAITILEQNPSVSFLYGSSNPVRIFDPSDVRQDEHQDPTRIGPIDDCQKFTIIDGTNFIDRCCRVGMNRISMCSVLVRTNFQKKAGHYREELSHTTDLEMWLRLAMLGPVAETNAIQGTWLVHGANLSAYYQAKQTRDLLAIKDAFDSFFCHEGSHLPNAHSLHRQAICSIGERAYWSALSHLIRGHGSTTLALLKLAVSLRPLTAVVPPVNYLFRMDKPFLRIKEVFLEACENIHNLKNRKKRKY